MATLVNGRFWSYTNIEIALTRDGAAREVIAEISAIDYPQAVERERVWGTGKYPLGTTIPRSPVGEGAMEMYAQRYRELIANMGDGYAEVDLSIQVKMRDGQGPLFVDTLQALINGDEHSHAQGAGPLVVSVPLFYTQIKINGVSILA